MTDNSEVSWRSKTKSSIEYRVVQDHFESLVEHSQHVLTSLANSLFSEGIISRYEHRNTTDDYQTPYNRATKLVDSILTKVEDSNANFQTFIFVLKENRLHDIAEKLELSFKKAESSNYNNSTANLKDKRSADKLVNSSSSTVDEGIISSGEARHKTCKSSCALLGSLAVISLVLAVTLMYYEPNSEPVEPNPFNLDADEPRYVQVERLKIRGHPDIRILELVGPQCRMLGQHLGLSAEDLSREWDTVWPLMPARKCGNTLKRWLEGLGNSPVSWRTFIEALRDAELDILADELQQALT